MTTAATDADARRWLTTALVVGAVLAAHGITLAGGFVYDDLWVVVNNPFVKDPGNLVPLWTGAVPEGVPDANRPLVVTLYAVDHALFGLAPWGWHLHNLLWHLACALGVAWLAREIAWTEAPPRADGGGLPVARSEPIARAAGLLYAVHAVFTEAIAVVSYREDLVATAGVVVAMALVVRSRRTGGWAPIAPACLALLVATNAKEVVPVFPLLLAAFDAGHFRGGLRRFLRRAAWTYVPLTLAAFGSRFWLDALVSPDVLRSVQGAEGLAPLALLATGGKITLAYLGQLLLPVGLSPDYATRPLPRPDAASLAGLAAVVGLLGVSLASLRRRPLPAFGILWLLVALLPTSGIAPLQNLRADRYLYLPGVGFALAAGWALVRGAGWLAPRVRLAGHAPALLASALALVCLVHGSLAFARNRVWHDELTLWEHTLRAQPGSARAKVALLSEYLRRGRVGDAWRLGREAVREHPESWQLKLNLGRLELARGRPRQALALLEQAAALGGAGDPGLVENLAIAHLHAGDPQQALARLAEAAQRWPGHARIQRQLGGVALEQGDPARAARALTAAVTLEPGDAEAHRLLARAHLQLGDPDAASAAIERALALDPDRPGALRLRARIERRRRAERARPEPRAGTP